MVINKELLVAVAFYSVLAIAGLAIVLCVLSWIQRTHVWPYKKVPIMSGIEKKFYRQLLTTFPHYHIFAQVQLSRVIRPLKGKNELKWLNKI